MRKTKLGERDILTEARRLLTLIKAEIGAGAGHDPVTLATDANTILGLSTQEITLDTQAPNTFFLGPASGVSADPTFREQVKGDVREVRGQLSASLFTMGEVHGVGGRVFVLPCSAVYEAASATS